MSRTRTLLFTVASAVLTVAGIAVTTSAPAQAAHRTSVYLSNGYDTSPGAVGPIVG